MIKQTTDQDKWQYYEGKAADLRLKGNAVSPAFLWQAFDDNEVAAEDAYKGNAVCSWKN